MAGSFFSRWFGGGRRWNAFDDRGAGSGAGGHDDLGVGAGTAGDSSPVSSGATAAMGSSFEYAPLPKERIAGMRSLFTWSSWMVRAVLISRGISIIQYLYILAYCLVGIFCFLAVAQALMSGSAGYSILYIVLTPVWLIILTMAFRLVAELAISVLMAPHLLNQQHKELVRLLGEQQLASARLFAQQQQGQATHCPESELEGGMRGISVGSSTGLQQEQQQQGGSAGLGAAPASSFRGIGSSGSYSGGGVRRGPITAGDADEEEVGIHMASV